MAGFHVISQMSWDFSAADSRSPRPRLHRVRRHLFLPQPDGQRQDEALTLSHLQPRTRVERLKLEVPPLGRNPSALHLVFTRKEHRCAADGIGALKKNDVFRFVTSSLLRDLLDYSKTQFFPGDVSA